ncbi:homeobox, partial [Basidiobolus meristosporus CBS 931.73]
KRRNRLSARQVTRLMEVFDQTTKPKTDIRVKLAEELEMHPRAVQIWFQNRRQKLKK